MTDNEKHLASDKGNLKMSTLLIKRGADVEKRAGGGGDGIFISKFAFKFTLNLVDFSVQTDGPLSHKPVRKKERLSLYYLDTFSFLLDYSFQHEDELIY